MDMATNESDEGKPWYKKPENVLVYGGLAGLAYVAVQFLDGFWRERAEERRNG